MNHGSDSTYSNHRCRCESCRAAHAAAQAKRRRVRAVLLRANPDSRPHGTESTYTNWMCRCPHCSEAHMQRARSRRGVS